MATTYTIQITFNGAKNLPVADIGTLSCDPYILAELSIPETEPLKFRTPTVRRDRDPTWDAVWLVSGVPQSGCKLTMILYDEDPGELHDDRLGKAVARLGPDQMKEGFENLNTEYTLLKRKGDFHPYILTYLAALVPGQKLRRHNRVVASFRVLRKDADADQKDAPGMYTLGPNHYSRHFSPLIGCMVNKAPQKDADAAEDGQTDGRGVSLAATTFIANKVQLTGPVPRALRHRFVGYKPFINWMFADKGVAGRLLHHGLRKQYRTVYRCDKSTVWGVVDDTGAPGTEEGEDAEALARQFLEMTAWGEGAKLFTYVITLDGEWRFTETGPEFGIDMLSKHSMHADLAKEIAYSGEFFVRPRAVERTGNDRNDAPGQDAAGQDAAGKDASPKDHDAAKENHNAAKEDTPPSRSPHDYELIIDNDSGTYRPKKELLPVLQTWLADGRRLGALGGVCAMDGFDEGLKGMKEARGKEKAELTGVEADDGKEKGTNGKKGKKGKGKGGKGRMVPVRAGSSVSSISSGAIGRESVSSEEVEDALKKMEDANAQGGDKDAKAGGEAKSDAQDGRKRDAQDGAKSHAQDEQEGKGLGV
ncbi:hypothetical protein B0H15DRAFT_274648 [Mycena belliarum]|uniref:C2 domain-containing protein n=1 Tax=Mycena belliarum TaxID=1033014 RepID=A0AAD6U448_9AGAR|nr:hypothetical protein B0H15DRAFT_274648 [Mycena belliae]